MPPPTALQDSFTLRCPAHTGAVSQTRLLVRLQQQQAEHREALVVRLVVSEGPAEQRHAHAWPAGAWASAASTLTIDIGPSVPAGGLQRGHERLIGFTASSTATVLSAQLHQPCTPGAIAPALAMPPSVIGAPAQRAPLATRPGTTADAWRSDPLPIHTRFGPAYSD